MRAVHWSRYHIHNSFSGGWGVNIITSALKSIYYAANNNVPDTVVPRTLSQEPVLLTHRIRRRSVPRGSQTKAFSVSLFVSSQFFCSPCLSYPSAISWPVLKSSNPPITAQISSALACWELRYFYFADVTGFRSPNPDFLIEILLRAPTMGEKDFSFQRKDEPRISPDHILNSRKIILRVSGDVFNTIEYFKPWNTSFR